jgi:hypothetical protein
VLHARAQTDPEGDRWKNYSTNSFYQREEGMTRTTKQQGRTQQTTYKEDEYQKYAERLHSYLGNILKSRANSKVKRIDDFELLRTYCEVKARLGREPREADVGRSLKHSRNTFRNHFGSYDNFLAVIGVIEGPPEERPIIPRSKLVWDEERPRIIDLIREFRKVKEKLGRTPTYEELGKMSRFEDETFRKVILDPDKLSNRC